MDVSRYAPVALFVYDRIDHTKAALEALKKNRLAADTPLHIFCDGPKNDLDRSRTQMVRNYVRSVSGFMTVTIHERDVNWGLASSIISGVTYLCSEYGKVIVLEDDLVSAPSFLEFMNDALSTFQDQQDVLSICGYTYPLSDWHGDEPFFLPMPSSWGWATWDRSWELYQRSGKEALETLREKGLAHEFDKQGPYSCIRMLKDQIAGANNSWFVRWHATACIHGKFSLYPPKSLIRNIGFDGSGVHCNVWRYDPFDTNLSADRIPVKRIVVEENAATMKAVEMFYRKVRRFRYLNYVARKVGLT